MNKYMQKNVNFICEFNGEKREFLSVSLMEKKLSEKLISDNKYLYTFMRVKCNKDLI